MTFASVLFTTALLATPQDPLGGTLLAEPIAQMTMADAGADVPANSMEEHIEVLRQILRRKLNPGPTVSGHASLPSELAPLYGGQTANANTLLAQRGYLTRYSDGGDLGIEGVYLPGYGVVFTATLPTSRRDGKVTETKPVSKPLSDWERTQKELRGEKVEPVTTQTTTRGPSTRDIIAQVLADNGRHLSKLRDDERLTVVITFRGSAAGTSMYNPVTTNATTLFGAYLSPGGQTTQVAPSSAAPALTPSQSGKQASSAHDYLMLGDLHLKQQQYQSALDTYRKAMSMFEDELKSSPAEDKNQRLGAMLSRQAQALIALGKYAEAQDVLERVQGLRDGKGQDSPSVSNSTKVRLPTKLIVSATKRQLDQVAAGRMKIEEFRKAISVEEE
jgi:tetratricopeptide (TPR) repeat protein